MSDEADRVSKTERDSKSRRASSLSTSDRISNPSPRPPALPVHIEEVVSEVEAIRERVRRRTETARLRRISSPPRARTADEDSPEIPAPIVPPPSTAKT